MIADKLGYYSIDEQGNKKYHFAITNSPDGRGIDVALFTILQKKLKFERFEEFVMEESFLRKSPPENLLGPNLLFQKRD